VFQAYKNYPETFACCFQVLNKGGVLLASLYTASVPAKNMFKCLIKQPHQQAEKYLSIILPRNRWIFLPVLTTLLFKNNLGKDGIIISGICKYQPRFCRLFYH
jgi:hypothetical protein